MRTMRTVTQTQGSLISDYASRMSEALIRNRAEIEVRAARVEAELSIKARSEFLANMNHELRTPLNAIIGFATMLRDIDEYDLSAEQKKSYAEYILQSADLLLGHINTLLEIAALDSGNLELHDDVVDCCVTLEAAMTRAKIRADAAGVSIERRDEGEDVLAWGDTERIGQAIDHLLQTAIKSCPKSGRILVRACVEESGWAEIAIRDNGEGFDNKELHEALEAFKQVHRGLDRSFAGPGVGYAVAKTFVEMQGGRFFIKSRKGQGTLVRITLPPPRDAANVTHPDPNEVTKDAGAQQGARENMERADDAA